MRSETRGLRKVSSDLTTSIWSELPEITLQPSYPWEVNFFLRRCKIKTTVYMDVPELFRGARQLEWTSCLISAGRVTLEGGTTFLRVNSFARLTGRALVARVTNL